ncbi:MAG: class I SAM-dependent methyltransferase [Alphaproteobacteria bacterium]|nr:class I SAM-dependent methyltransferase [Alphaproteobacteria bacterium]
MSQSWSAGYVTDIAYIEGFYVQQAPIRMALAGLLGNVAVDLPQPDDEACYVELGCGVGIGALLIAASNPRWKVVAIDYNPAHIAIANGLARNARIGNIEFLEADLAELADSAVGAAIPTADFVSMHGLWSWVSPAVRTGIVRFLARKTRPGALVHISYNALPAWQGGIALQRIVYEAGMRAGGRSDKRADAGMALARDLKQAEARYFTESSLTRELLDSIQGMSREYLSHEYMNSHWSPAFHADVVAAMAEAKLDWAASANPLENFPELLLTIEQRKLMDRYSDPVMRELIKDSCLQRPLRHDVYVRGARRIGNAERDSAIARLTLTPVVPPEELETTLHVPVGTAEMSDALKKIMTAAVRGPATIADLLALEPEHSNAPEVVGVLVGTHQCQVALRADGEQPDSANRLNRLLASRIKSVADARTSGLACARLGTGLTAPPILQFIAGRLLAGDTEANAEDWLETLRPTIRPEKLDTVRKVIHTTVEQRVPILRQLQIVPELN